MVIILRIIFMTGWRNKNGIKINRLNSQILKIIKLLQNPLEISSVKLPEISIRIRILSPAVYLNRFFTNIVIFTCKNIICGITISESVHKNLVHYSTLCPVRCSKIRYHPESVLVRHCSAHSPLVIKKGLII